MYCRLTSLEGLVGLVGFVMYMQSPNLFSSNYILYSESTLYTSAVIFLFPSLFRLLFILRICRLGMPVIERRLSRGYLDQRPPPKWEPHIYNKVYKRGGYARGEIAVRQTPLPSRCHKERLAPPPKHARIIAILT